MATNPVLRRRIAAIHRWCGIGLGAGFLMVAVTGATLVFRPQLEHAPLAHCPAPLPLDTLIANARAVSPQAGPLRFVRLAENANTRVRFDDGTWIDVDPCSGAVRGKQALYGGAFGTAAWVHIYSYVDGHETVAGSFAAVFALLMLGGGAYLWWPANLKVLRNGLRFKRGLSGRAFMYNAHKTVAQYAAPVLFTSAVTGMFQAFSWGAQPALPAVVANGSGQASAESMWRAVQAQLPTPHKVQMRFPQGDGAVLFEVVAADAPHANAVSYVAVDPHSAAILGSTEYARNSIIHRVSLTAAALHYGWIGGIAGQCLLFLGALAVPFLAFTGISSFLRRNRKAP